MTRRIYVAGCREDLVRIRQFNTKLRAAGWTITHDWTEAVLANANRPDATIPADEQRSYANDDWDGVCNADAFWLVAPSTGGTGCWIEFGMAVSSAITTIVVSGAHKRSIFTALDGVDVYDTHEEALVKLLRRRGR
jgi:hypothetical protein